MTRTEAPKDLGGRLDLVTLPQMTRILEPWMAR
jgi:hypothetical protein